MHLPALYRRLLSLYPADYREEFGDEMAWVFQQAHSDIRRESGFALVIFLARELQGVLVGSACERARGLFDSHTHASWKGGSMESKFRFPRATLVLMLLSLLAVVLSLEEARVVEMHYGNKVGMPPEWPMLLWIFGRILLIALVVASVLWGIFFALRRSGIQRLEQLKPWHDQK
ncbi:MAG TPA: hypothetical protein VKD70_13280 [Candidatus Acidoferrum sp.]|nr:hypothetical protein [Candidatus Acidoferrum sp.]